MKKEEYLKAFCSVVSLDKNPPGPPDPPPDDDEEEETEEK
jgi:hypothetical protein